MKVFIAGGGPAGLYAAYRIKKSKPDATITLVEQNAPDATFGFGVVFSERALDFLRDDDPETHALIAPAMETWTDLAINHDGETIRIDGIGFAAIGRLKLLQLLQNRLASVGVTPRFETAIRDAPRPTDYDLIIAADGVNSIIRTANDFDTTVMPRPNKFVWYGTTKPFSTLTQTFVRTTEGHFNAHHYRYAPDMSTFIVECDEQTWRRMNFDTMTEAESAKVCESIFATTLQGHPLLTNHSLWRNFPNVWNDRWYQRNMVLVGDALRTAHFSIGSGTRLALEDVIALVDALIANRFDVGKALPAYQAARRPIVEKLVAAANASAQWYESFPQHMELRPWDFAWSYIQRSGRIDADKLRSVAPRFVTGYEAGRGDSAPATMPMPMRDPVPMDAPGARAIGFSVPERYNASAILFDNLLRGHGGRIAVTGPAGTRTYADLCAEASAVGNGLVNYGARRGERVICLLDDTPAYPAIIFGAMRAGVVPVLLNTLTPANLIQFYVQDSGARVAFLESDLFAKLGADAFASAGIALIVLLGTTPAMSASAPTEAGSQIISYDAFREGQSDRIAGADTHRDDMAFWMYSSGSTGNPKGVVHLHHDMAYTAESYARHILKLSKDDICFSVPKIFFAYGFGNSCTFPFAVGAASVLLPGRPEPRAVFETVARYRPTVFFGLPTLYTALINDSMQAVADFRSVRLCVSAAEVLASEVFQAWRNRFGHQIVEGLGSTEVLHIYLSNTESEKRLGSAGRPVPGYEIKLVGLDGSPERDNGVLMVRGTSSAPCYWNRPDKTTETMRGDWIWTGDRFDRDDDDFYYFRGRADDLIKVSGQWVYPLEVELCLADHPHVKECAVLGLELPDHRMTLKAFVVLTGGTSPDEGTTGALQAFVKSRLVPYKYPRVIEYLPILPKTGTGKIDRHALRTRPLTQQATISPL
jgi:benzoate-CoA ligase family protein